MLVVYHGDKLEGGLELVEGVLVVQCDQGDVALALRVRLPRADVALQGDLSYGLLPTESRAVKAFQIINSGDAPAVWKVEWDRNLAISVEPSEGVIPAAAAGVPTAVSVSVGLLTGESAVGITGEVTIQTATAVGGCTAMPTDQTRVEVRKLALSGASVRQTLEMLDSGGVPLTDLDFGPMYFGESAQASVVVFNNGPVEGRYIVSHGTASEMKVKAGGDGTEPTGATPGPDDPDDPYADYVMAARQKVKARSSGNNPFTITPLTASIAPYSKAILTVHFQPTQQPSDRGFAATTPTSDKAVRSFEYMAVLEFSGVAGKLKLPIRAKGYPGGVRASPPTLSFGDVPTHSWADQLLHLTNTSSLLGAKYEVLRGSPYFDAIPARGTVSGGQVAQLLVRYNPKAMGCHTSSLPIRITSEGGHVIQQLHLTLDGSSLRLGGKPSLVGGSDKLPKDFDKARHYVDDEQVMLSKVESTRRTGRFLAAPWEKPDIASAFEDVGAGNQVTMSRGEYQTLAAHRDKYTTLMRAGRSEKLRQAKQGKVAEDDINLGMDTHSGLHAPSPALQKTVDPLWTVESVKEGAPRSQRTWSDKELSQISVHKDHPSGDVERVQVSRELSKEELIRLIVGPKTLDFGKVSVGCSVTQHLVVSNTLDAPIHVVLDVKSHVDFKRSLHPSQVIPPGCRAKFAVTLSPLEPHTISERIEYCINGSHMLSFAATANVSAVNVELSSEELTFEFSLDKWDDFVERPLLMDNPDKFPVHYTLACTAPTFTPSHTSGVIKPQSSSEVAIRWAPIVDGSDTRQQQGYLVITMVGGDAPRRVYLRGELPEGNLKLREKALDAGPVPCGLPHTLVMQIRNHGTRDSAFKILPNSLVKVFPERAKVAPEEVLDVEVTFTIAAPGFLATVLEVEVRGSKPLKMPLKAEGVIPSVEVLQDDFAFESTFTGAVSKHDLTLVNTTAVPAVLTVDLTQHHEFQLIIGKDAWSTSEYETCPLVTIGAVPQSNGGAASSMPGRMGSSDGHGSRLSSRRGSSCGNAPHGETGRRYHITLNPSKQLELQLVYRPTTTNTHAFDLNFVTVTSCAIPAPPLRKVVTASGTQPRLVFSKTSVEFGQRIVIQSNHIKAPYLTELFLTNTHDEPLSVTFGEATSSLADGVAGILALDVVPGVPLVVQPGVMAQVGLRFMPRDAKVYDAIFPVYLDNDRSAPYLSLEVTGTGLFPRIRFDVRECVLPPVPLGFRSQAVFNIINNGYDNLELKFRLPADEVQLPIKIEFPLGTLIGIAKQSLPVLLSFASATPISFTANIDFMDEEGTRYSLPITGTTDNCLLTNQAFLQANAASLVYSIEAGQPVSLERRDGYVLPAPHSALGPPGPSRNLTRYLHATSSKAPLGDLRRQMLASRGKLLAELVESLSGKPVPGKVAKLSSNKKEAAKQMLAQYDAVLLFLKRHGALLNAVKAEMLLEEDDFVRVLNDRTNQSSGVEETEAVDLWGDVEQNFDAVSNQCWTNVMLQVFKIFVLSRVTLKTLKALPGMTSLNLPPDSAFTGSNVYSVSESILLAWASAHYTREFGAKVARVTNFDTDFASGAVLFSLLAAYWPSLSSKRRLLRLGVSSGGVVRQGDYLDNAEVIIKILAELGLPFDITPCEVCEPDPREMLILVLYLYLTLPQFVPRATVDFHCKLGETQVKDLELSNPSKKSISYTARLEGNRDFSMESTLVRLDPRGTLRLPIKCTPTTTLPEESRLVLMSRKDAGAHAATLVFLLRSTVNTRAPLKRVRTEGPLYDLQSFEFTVANPFPADGDFTVTLLHEPAEAQMEAEVEVPKKGARAVTKASATHTADGVKTKVWPDAFGLDRLRLRLKQGASEKVRGFFLPFTLGSHFCTVLLRDKDQGEFAYELVGSSTLPGPLIEAKGSVALELPAPLQTFDITVPYINTQLEAAKRLFLDRHPLGKDREQAALVKADPFKLATTARSRPQTAPPPPHTRKPPVADPVGPNTIRLQLKPVGVGIYPTRLLLTSPLDTRVVDVELAAQVMTQAFTLEFTTTARQPITQDVPLVNTSTESSMTVGASITGSAFSGPREVSVPAGCTVNYPLQFRPVSTGVFNGVLELSIPSTGERNTYTLQGRAREPVAEAHIIVECQARKPATKAIAVPNIVGSAADYSVLCDLDFVSGPASVRVTMGVPATYKLTASPSRSGTYMGSITFTTADNQFVWYSMEVRVKEPPPVGIIEVSSTVRKAVQMQLKINNPTGSDLDMKVRYTSPALLGPAVLVIPPALDNAPYTFEFFYVPLFAGASRGSIMLVNDKLGEFWYEVLMTAEPAPLIQLPQLSCELGTTASHTVTLDNPLDKTVQLTCSCSNARNFSVTPDKVVLGPFASHTVCIGYAPSALGAVERSGVSISSSEIGTWEYVCSGVGLPPTVMPEAIMTGVMGGQGSAAVTWQNPFAESVEVFFALDSTAPAGTFEILPHTQAASVAAYGSVAGVVVFRPQQLQTFSAEWTVTLENSSYSQQPLVWRYPIRAFAEAKETATVFRFSTRARCVCDDVIEVVLTGLGAVSRDEEFTHEVLIPQESRAVLASSLSITPVQPQRLPSPHSPLRYRMLWSPAYPLAPTTVELAVLKASGGRWRFEIQLEASEADLDGSITIEAASGTTASSPVLLYSSTHQAEPFTASLSADTPLLFNILPAQGFLPPAPGMGEPEPEAPLRVSYTCRDFGKVARGRLNVSAGGVLYTFDLRGRVPQYTPPSAARRAVTVDARLTPAQSEMLAQAQQPNRRNFLMSNTDSKSSFNAKEAGGGRAGSDYLHEIGAAQQYNINVTHGQTSEHIDYLFTGNTLGHKTDIADGSLRHYEMRTFNNLVGDYYVSPRFLERVALHIARIYLVEFGGLDPRVRAPLILGVWGEKGMGKTFQTELALKAMGAEAVVMSAGELENEWAGAPGRLIRERYRRASQISKVHGKITVLLINDLDAGIGHFDNTQITVNNQMVVGTLMNICDDPTRVSTGQNWREQDIIRRVPIIVTGNDFSTIFAPLVRCGRMDKFYWSPEKEDLVAILFQLYKDDGLKIKDMEVLLERFKGQPLDFFGALRASMYDSQIRDWIVADVIGGEISHENSNLAELSKRLVGRTGLPEFEPVQLTLDMLLTEGARLERESALVRESSLSKEYLKQSVHKSTRKLIGLQG
ncbi:MAG: hypothetical protein WDW36_003110 [Sanguina aurantia]